MIGTTRTYPHGRSKKDDARQPFTSIVWARATAELLEHMTGITAR